MLIGFVGLKGSGKSVAADVLVEAGFVREKLASSLKAMLRAIGLTDRHIEGDLKDVPCALLGDKTPRWAMQTLGTEWGRGHMDQALWVRLWSARAMAQLHAGARVVVDDVRFPNEAEAVKRLGGRLIRVLRPGAASSDAHESERHSLALPQDYTILNRGTLEELRAAVRKELL